MKLKKTTLQKIIVNEIKKQINEAKGFSITRDNSKIIIVPDIGMLQPDIQDSVIDIIQNTLRIKNININRTIEIELSKPSSASEFASIVSSIHKQLGLNTKRKSSSEFIISETFNKQNLLEYTLDRDDINVIKDIIRDEVAEILRDLWKKKNIWT